MTRPVPILDRIRAAFKPGERRLDYHTLAHRVYPRDQFPNAWGRPTRGGPPGCYMAFSAALRRHKVPEWFEGDTRWIGKP